MEMELEHYICLANIKMTNQILTYQLMHYVFLGVLNECIRKQMFNEINVKLGDKINNSMYVVIMRQMHNDLGVTYQEE